MYGPAHPQGGDKIIAGQGAPQHGPQSVGGVEIRYPLAQMAETADKESTEDGESGAHEKSGKDQQYEGEEKKQEVEGRRV